MPIVSQTTIAERNVTPTPCVGLVDHALFMVGLRIAIGTDDKSYRIVEGHRSISN